VELEPENEAARWNLGIAATMLERWKVARTCWNVFGMNFEIIDEDTVGDVGDAPIRINPDGDAEIVWATRLCPARAEIYNIPFPKSGHGFKDIVLNDGAPKGYRMRGDKKYPVFDEIQHLKRSAYHTFSIKCDAQLERDPEFENLQERCREARIAMEDWTSVKWLCRQCSEGTPHETHDEEIKSAPEEYHIAFAALSLDDLKAVLHRWSDDTGIDYYDASTYD
jgi:hypothetical protein